MPTAQIIFGNHPLPIGIDLPRGQRVKLDFDYVITNDYDNDEYISITNLRGFIIQPSGQVVKELTALDRESIEANDIVQAWMNEKVYDLTHDDRGP